MDYEYKSYMHIEKFGNTEVEGIELGTVYVFPKVDGTNACCWYDDEKQLFRAGSRKRELNWKLCNKELKPELTTGDYAGDNQGFAAWLDNAFWVKGMLRRNPNLIFYGEWLVPHTLKTYKDACWNQFYIFDVYNRETDQWLTYDQYKPILDKAEVEYPPPIAIIKNGSSDQFYKCMEQNTYLLKDGEGVGEGIVLKNYDFHNKYGRQVWAKFITSEFKTQHHKAMGAPEIGIEPIELKIARDYITEHFVGKVVAKIVNQEGGWSSKHIPRLLETVFYDLTREEMYEIIKTYKNPYINFKALRAFVTGKIKEVKPELF